MERPLIAITMGDPAGIGPETIVGAWRHAAVHAASRPLVVGHPEILRRAVRLLGAHETVVEIDAPEAANPDTAVIPCLRCGGDDVLDVEPATIDPRAGQAAYDALARSTELAQSGRIAAIVTAPLCKVSLNAAGHDEPGHTEILARLCGVEDYAMMLYLGPGAPLAGAAGLAAVHVTLHTALADVPRQLTPAAVLATTRLAAEAMQGIKGSPARVAVCALNPHAGEQGLFGDEEQRIIAPAICKARAEGLDVEGPLPADTMMVRARNGDFDVVVAMYHDQGHIALKLLGMDRAVNVTLGLPIVRTSVAHGTAFDIAWQGKARPDSMIEAIRVAARLTRCRFAKKTAVSTEVTTLTD